MHYPYQPNYCEENIWHLCHARQPEAGQVIVVSSMEKAVPVYFQRAAPSPLLPVVWDYHVFYLSPGEQPLVFDPDSLLGFPVAAGAYFRRSFPAEALRLFPYEPLLRVVPAGKWLQRFYSDRSHMRGEGGKWLATPPDWPPVTPANGVPLQKILDFSDKSFGRVVSLASFTASFKN